MRDRASGSVVVRQPSNTRSNADGPFDISDCDLDASGEEADSLSSTLPTLSRTPTATRPKASPVTTTKYLELASQPPMPLSMLQSTTFIKHTRRKKKQMLFWLDDTQAEIQWASSPEKSRKKLFIDHIKELRKGADAPEHLAEFEIPADSADRWLTVIYSDATNSKGRTTKSLHVLAPDRRVLKSWLEWLEYLMGSRGDMMASIAGSSEAHREKVWEQFTNAKSAGTRHKDNCERMDFSELRNLCRKYAINKSDRDLRQRFHDADERQSGWLDRDQFLQLFRKLAQRRDLLNLFNSIKAADSDFLQHGEFVAFLKDAQGIDVAADPIWWDHVFEQYQVTAAGLGISLPVEHAEKRPLGMSWESFQNFMISHHLAWDMPLRRETKLNKPLGEYYISSSHNTYLMGRQVAGTSDPEGYKEALRKGCRSVEIDCWDGDDGRPKVTHGRTLSSKVSFEDCIRVVNKYAFVASPYPVIVSLEVHCCAQQQRIMADMMRLHFGARLITKPVRDDGTMPSPEELRQKILIKVKKPAVDAYMPPLPPVAMGLAVPPTNTQHRRQRSQSEPNPGIIYGKPRKMSTPYVASLESLGSTPSAPPLPSPLYHGPALGTGSTTGTSLASGASSISGSSTDDSDGDMFESPTAAKKRKPKTSKICQELGELGVYTRGIKFTDFKSSESRTFDHVYSFNENTFDTKCKTHKEYLEDHNMRYLMRVYPRPTRLTSSNFDPIQFWRRGVQMVATNWQTMDLGTQINDAMFAVGSDRTGYVLKPEELRPTALGSMRGSPRRLTKKSVRFSVDIISARRLARTGDMHSDAEMNPYVELEMFSAEDKAKGIATGEGGFDASARNGVSGIGSPLRKRTKIIEGNGFDPIWNETISLSLETKYPSLVFVRFTVWNSSDGKTTSRNKEPLARFVAKLSSLPQGYRHFSLQRGNDEQLLSQLFCRISKEEIREAAAAPSEPLEAATDPVARSSEDSTRTGKDILRSLFQRTPSERRKPRKDNTESGYFSRTTSVER